MFGIPITMIMFQSMGERMNKFFSIVIKKYRDCRGLRTEVSEFDLIFASGFTSTVVVTLGAFLFHTQEGKEICKRDSQLTCCQNQKR